jgi:hypothetical protein
MIAILLMATAVLILAVRFAGEGVDLFAVRDWDIVVAPDAAAPERYAAEEFRDHFEKATGVQLPLVASSQGSGHVLIGPGAAGVDAADFGAEDSRIAIGDGRIAIAGGRPRGTLYGVYTVLEDFLGVRFLTADHTHVPHLKGPRVVGPLERAARPALSFRWPYYGENRADPAFAARLRVNTVTDDPRLGGRDPMGLVSHTFQRFLPSRVYGAEHPDYYALRDGRRLAPFEDDRYETQPCLSHPDVLRIVTEQVMREIEENPTRGNVSVSQNDNKKHCQCDACRAVDEREESAMGSLLAFVNAVAERVAARCPHVKVGTLAYQYSRRAPRHLRPGPNVQIQLCSIECCMMHPIDDPTCPRNVEFCRDLADWGRISNDIRIWNYNTNFHNYLLPCPNLRVIEPNVRYFVRNNARGVFMQAAGNARGAELSDLRNYVIACLLWDPSRSGRILMDEFLDLHYGEAAPPIRRFINRVHDNAEARGLHHHCFGRAADYGIDEEIARSGLEACEEALSLAASDEVRARVEKASIPAVRAALEPVWYAEKAGDVPPELAERMRPLAERLFALCASHGVTHAWEYGTIEEARARLEAVLGIASAGPA